VIAVLIDGPFFSGLFHRNAIFHCKNQENIGGHLIYGKNGHFVVDRGGAAGWLKDPKKATAIGRMKKEMLAKGAQPKEVAVRRNVRRFERSRFAHLRAGLGRESAIEK
jgi:hypothetical protein